MNMNKPLIYKMHSLKKKCPDDDFKIIDENKRKTYNTDSPAQRVLPAGAFGAIEPKTPYPSSLSIKNETPKTCFTRDCWVISFAAVFILSSTGLIFWGLINATSGTSDSLNNDVSIISASTTEFVPDIINIDDVAADVPSTTESDEYDYDKIHGYENDESGDEEEDDEDLSWFEEFKRKNGRTDIKITNLKNRLTTENGGEREKVSWWIFPSRNGSESKKLKIADAKGDVRIENNVF